MFPPLPYLAGGRCHGRRSDRPDFGWRSGLARALSALMALLAVVSVGLAVRNLQQPGSTWSVPAVATVGLALMPGLHSMGASVTASTWALAAVGLTCAATAGPCGVTGHSAPPRPWSARRLSSWRPAPAPIPSCCSSRWPCLLTRPLRAAVLRLSAVAGCDSGQRLVDGSECLGHRRPTRCGTCTSAHCRCGCLRHCARKPGCGAVRLRVLGLRGPC